MDTMGFRPGQRLLERLRDRDDGPLQRWRDRRNPDPAPTPGPAPDNYVPTPQPYAPQPYAPQPYAPQPYAPPQPAAYAPAYAPPPPVPAYYPPQAPAYGPVAPPAPPAWPGGPGPSLPIPAMPGPLGLDLHVLGSKVVGFLLKAWNGLLTLLGLRKPGDAVIDARFSLPGWIKGGIDGQARVYMGPNLAPGQAPGLRAEVNVGPEVLREIEGTAYTLACQAIATRQLPDLSVPDIAKNALARMGAGNADGRANGAIAINLNEPALVEAVRAGLTRAVVDTPLRRHTLRPGGMVHLRAALVNSGLAQKVIVQQAEARYGQVQRQLETLSNGVLCFHDVPVGQTGARVRYTGDGYLVDASLTPRDVQKLLAGNLPGQIA